jgi:ribosomal protein L32
MKHKQYFPKPVQWYFCEKCGESKLPHRICTKHLDICAMKPDEWKEYKAKRDGDQKKQESTPKEE